MQSNLPKSTLESDSTNMADTSEQENSSRTLVGYVTKSTNPTYYNLVSKKEAMFIFDRNCTIRQAAKIAASHYPKSRIQSAPVFDDVWVFFPNSDRPAVTDLEVNFYSMFGDRKAMIVSNDPDVIEFSYKETNRILCTIFGVIFLLVLVLTFILSP